MNNSILDCGFDATVYLSRGVIKSPNYPQPYPANVSCEWNIYEPNSNYIEIDFKDFIEIHVRLYLNE